MNYEKPVAVNVENLSEGIYLASGSTQGSDNQNDNNQIVCQSKYMNGIWQKPTTGAQQAPVKIRRGCEGCSADDGDGCKILKGGELNANGVFKPTWEQSGMSPDTLVW